MNFLKKKYISQKGESNLLEYKYSGSDASYLYKYVFSPLAQALVDYVLPEWLAPNVITLLGFTCTLVPHCIIWAYQGSSLSGYTPFWVPLSAAIGTFCYMILDNADGKQARKTGNSSPLGLLMDHGCDAMNTFVTGLSIFGLIQFGNTVYSLLGYTIIFGIFYLFNWEEYYTETLALPWFNGANEGLFGAILIFLVTAIFGTDFWYNEYLGLAYWHFVFFFYIIPAVPTVISNLYTVYKIKKGEFCKTLKYLVIPVYLVLTMLITNYFSISDTVSRTCRFLIYFIGFSHAKLVGLLQASHCCHIPFEQFRYSIIIPTTLLNLNTLIGYFTKSPLMDEDTVIYALAAFSLAAYLHFSINIINQFTRVLNIKVFKVKPKNNLIAAQIEA